MLCTLSYNKFRAAIQKNADVFPAMDRDIDPVAILTDVKVNVSLPFLESGFNFCI